jgi:hypothetical protein
VLLLFDFPLLLRDRLLELRDNLRVLLAFALQRGTVRLEAFALSGEAFPFAKQQRLQLGGIVGKRSGVRAHAEKTRDAVGLFPRIVEILVLAMSRFNTTSRATAIPLPPSHARQINAVQQHRQFRRRHVNATALIGRLGKAERPRLKPLEVGITMRPLTSR